MDPILKWMMIFCKENYVLCVEIKCDVFQK